VDQQIRFCTAADGVRIAYASVGGGPPLVKAANWLSHLEFDWQSPVWRHWLEALAAGRRLVRYDERGCGLSDWDVEDLSFETWVRDLEAVVDAAGLERFPLLGISQGGAVAAAYTIRHPERVSHLIMYGTFARGWMNRGRATRKEFDAQLGLIKLGWGKDNPAYRQVFTSQFMPEATLEQMGWFNDLQRVSTSPENAVRLQKESGKIDVRELLPQVSVPTVVLHCRGDARVPFEEGRLVASLIPNAHFVPLDGNNHLPQEGDPCWEPLIREVRRFLGVSEATPGAAAATVSPGVALSSAPDAAAHAFIATLDEVRLSRFRVVGNYTRYDEHQRHTLKDVRQKIAAGFDASSRKRENHLIWASPGSGKTYYAQQVAASLSDRVRYHEINLAKCDERDFESRLGALDTTHPCLCLVDEIDAKPRGVWPYEMLLPYLDAAAERGARFVFVLAGSSGSNIGDMKERMASRPKGSDLLSRIPGGNEYEISPMGLGDRVLVVLTQLRRAGSDAGRDIRAIEKLGLLYVALNPRLVNARQLREFAVRAVESVPAGDDRVKYDHLFTPGDPENKAFWVRAIPAASDFVNTFTVIED